MLSMKYGRTYRLPRLSLSRGVERFSEQDLLMQQIIRHWITGTCHMILHGRDRGDFNAWRGGGVRGVAGAT